MTTSSARTSGADPPDPMALARAGWSEIDLAWEHMQEVAAERDSDGDQVGAAELWSAALRLARAHFAENDPRLATSLTNHAVALRRSGDDAVADWLFEEALLVWDTSGPWIDSMRPDRRARSSTFHLRLERKHPGDYDRIARVGWARLATEGRAITRAHRDGRFSSANGLARWKRERPDGFSDLRKLSASVLLICPVSRNEPG